MAKKSKSGPRKTGKRIKRKPPPAKRRIHRGRGKKGRRPPATPPPSPVNLPAVLTEPTKPPIWSAFARAIGTEPRDATTIDGASGQQHEVLQIAVDEKANRLLVVSAEPDPRVAALVRHDIQSTTDAKVLLARPMSVDVGFLARNLVQFIGRKVFTLKEFGSAMQRAEALPGEQKTSGAGRPQFNAPAANSHARSQSAVSW